MDDTLDYWKQRAKRLEVRLLFREKMHRQNDVTAQRLGEARKRVAALETENAQLTEYCRLLNAETDRLRDLEIDWKARTYAAPAITPDGLAFWKAQPMGECDMTDCSQSAAAVLVDQAGDLWLCAEHAPPRTAQRDGADGRG